MQTVVHASIDKEQLWEKAKELNLSEKATHYFGYCNEVALILEVEQDTGKVTSIKVKEAK